MTDLRQLPAIRALAEERAERQTAAEGAVAHRMGWGYVANEQDAWVRIEAHLDLLTDLSRPDSRDAVARLVAAKVGIPLNGDRPADGLRWNKGGWGWRLTSDVREFFFVEHASGPCERTAPSISAITDPAEALRLIALATLSETT